MKNPTYSFVKSIEEFTSEQKLYSQMVDGLEKYLERKRSTGNKVFTLLWSVWFIGLILLQLNLEDYFDSIAGTAAVVGLILLIAQWRFYSELACIDSVLTFIFEDWDDERDIILGDKLGLIYKWGNVESPFTDQELYRLFKLNSTLSMLINGYDNELREKGGKGFSPIQSRLDIIGEHMKGRVKQPQPWFFDDGSVLTNPPF